ncbi:beta-lactamase [Calothrix sp. NIES-4101]|nr:beta-lactamase [Calothrix sp. NIES-4101]
MTEISRRQLIDSGIKSLIGLSTFSLLSLYRNRSLAATDRVITNLETQIPTLMRTKLVPGLELAIIHDGQLLWSKAFGVKNKSTRTPVNNDTIFAAASLSKPLFAYAVLKMVERGQLDLDTPLTNYTAKPYITDPRIKLITARMVLSHTTGFPNWSGDKPLTIDFTPGTKFSYSGEGYLYLQKVVEEITQQSLHEYLRNTILTPLGMSSSSYIWLPDYQSTASYGHDRQGKPTPMGKPKRASAAGSLRTTAIDYAKFLLAMMQSGSSDSPQLGESSLDEMLRSQIKINQSLDWGLGWGLEKMANENFFWHWGDLNTFKCFTLASRKSATGIVILTNSQNGLKISPQIVSQVVSGKHSLFNWRMIEY